MSNTDPDNIPHPNNISEEELKALRESDPSAFDDDVPSPEAKDDDDDDDDKKPVKVEKEDDDTPPEEKPTKSAMIPKARFDEVLNQKKTAEDLLAIKEAEIESLKAATVVKEEAKPDRDFDAEYLELDQKYDDGDLSHDEYKKAQGDLRKEERAFIEDRASDKAVEKITQRQLAHIKAEQDREWDDANKAWLADNAEFLKIPGARDAMQMAITFVENQTATNPPSSEDLLAKAHEVAAKMVGASVPEKKQSTQKQETARERSHREQREKAEKAPPAFQGGMGDRGAAPSKVDVSNMKPGTFSNLPKAEQEKLLGEGAI